MLYLGVEIGGTKLQAAVGDGEGAIERLERVAARPEEGRAGICRQVAELVRMLIHRSGHARSKLGRVGIGFGGPVDIPRRRVVRSHQVEGWDQFPIVDWFQTELGLEAVLGNDSDLAGLAEATFGAGKGKSPVFYMNIGSGIGGSLVVNGQLYTGQGRGAGEVGHLRMLPHATNADPQTSAGETGQTASTPWRTLEDLASGWQLAKRASEAAQRQPDSQLAMLAQNREVTSETLMEALDRDDAVARTVWNEAITYWAVALANVQALLDPACIILGGGISLAGDRLFVPLREAVRQQAFAPFAEPLCLVPASLGEAVVVHGALKLARDATNASRIGW